MNDFAWASMVVDHCLNRGIDHFFVAPGSRCTPLTLAIARCRDAKVVQHFDERGLAFAALGFAKATARPGVFVCTSGTAVANAYPAVIEASIESVPLLLFTADRPEELHGTGANQTIDQLNIFGDYPRHFQNMPVPGDLEVQDATEEVSFLIASLDQSFAGAKQGPVHLNWMFREPFTIADEQQELRPAVAVSAENADTQDGHSDQFPIEVEGNTLLAVGACQPEEARQALELADHVNCPMLSDITSGLRTGSFELPQQFSLPRPDTILQLGGRIVSKSWNQWTCSLAGTGTQFIHLTPTGQTVNPNRLPQKKLVTSLDNLPSKVTGATTSESFRQSWRAAAEARDQAIERTLSEIQRLNEPSIANYLFKNCPPSDGLFIGNSMPIRDLDWYGTGPGIGPRRVVANRGASGIDGLLATAAGFATGLQRSTTVVLGDLSALHDLNSLALIARLGCPIIVVIVNNQSGHIFDLLPVRESEHFERFFATPHPFRFENAAEMFGLAYRRIETMAELDEGYHQAHQTRQPAVLELITDRKRNLDVREQIRTEIHRCSTPS